MKHKKLYLKNFLTKLTIYVDLEKKTYGVALSRSVRI